MFPFVSPKNVFLMFSGGSNGYIGKKRVKRIDANEFVSTPPKNMSEIWRRSLTQNSKTVRGKKALKIVGKTFFSNPNSENLKRKVVSFISYYMLQDLKNSYNTLNGF